jgi:hypothetical protein
MIRSLLLLSLLGTTVAAAPKLAVSSKLKTVEVKDEALGIVAFRMQIPDNWTFEGIMLRDPNCGLLPTVAYRLASPDGFYGVQTLPQFGSHWSDDANSLAIFRKAHCKTMPTPSPADVLQLLAPAIRPDPKLGPVEPTTDAAQIDAMIAAYNERTRQARMSSKETGGGVRSRLTYQFRGEEIEENLRVVVTTFESSMGAHHMWQTTADVVGTRAPKGQLEDTAKALAPFVGKAAYTDEWMARMQKKIADDGARATAQLKIQGDATAAMLKRNHEAYMASTKAQYAKANAAERARQDAVHRSAQAWTLYAGDEQLVKNPKTGEVSRVTARNGTNGHQEQTSGDIIMSDDPSFDPNVFLRGTWTQLDNVQP